MNVLDVLGRPVTVRGRVLFHEHLQFGWPGFHLDSRVRAVPGEADVEGAVRAVEELAEAGFGLVIDVTTLECGRDKSFLQAVAARTRVQIVAAVGLYAQTRGFPFHFATLSADEIADLYMEDLAPDAPGGPAGVVKVATRQPPFSAREQRALEAAGKVAARRKVPIVTHAETLAGAWQQLEALRRAGAPANRIVLGHLDGAWEDPDGVAELASTGAFVGIDRFGHQERLPDEHRIRLLLALRERGRLDRVLVSHDAALRFLGRRELRPTGQNPYLHLPQAVVPELKRRGVTDAEIERLLVENPARLLGL